MESPPESISKALGEINQVYRISNQIGRLEYEIQFDLKRGPLFIRIRFAEDFPVSPPTLLVCSKAVHPRIDIFGIISFEEYYNWSENISILIVIDRLYNEFVTNQPVPSNESPFPQFTEYIQRYGHVQDDSDMIKIVTSTVEFKNLLEERDKILHYNLVKAKEILGLKQEYNLIIEDSTEQIAEFHYLTSELQNLNNAIQELDSGFSLSKLQESLKKKENSKKKAAEKTYKQLLTKEIGLGDFISTYKEQAKELKILQMIKDNS